MFKHNAGQALGASATVHVVAASSVRASQLHPKMCRGPVLEHRHPYLINVSIPTK